MCLDPGPKLQEHKDLRSIGQRGVVRSTCSRKCSGASRSSRAVGKQEEFRGSQSQSTLMTSRARATRKQRQGSLCPQKANAPCAIIWAYSFPKEGGDQVGSSGGHWLPCISLAGLVQPNLAGWVQATASQAASLWLQFLVTPIYFRITLVQSLRIKHNKYPRTFICFLFS